MQVNRILELKESILQCFRSTLSYHLSLRPLFCLFLSGRFRQVLLYELTTTTTTTTNNNNNDFNNNYKKVADLTFSFWMPANTYWQNSEDPDEMPHYTAFHQNLQCLQR